MQSRLELPTRDSLKVVPTRLLGSLSPVCSGEEKACSCFMNKKSNAKAKEMILAR